MIKILIAIFLLNLNVQASENKIISLSLGYQYLETDIYEEQNSYSNKQWTIQTSLWIVNDFAFHLSYINGKFKQKSLYLSYLDEYITHNLNVQIISLGLKIPFMNFLYFKGGYDFINWEQQSFLSEVLQENTLKASKESGYFAGMGAYYSIWPIAQVDLFAEYNGHFTDKNKIFIQEVVMGLRISF